MKKYQDKNNELNSLKHQNKGKCVTCGKTPRGTYWSEYFCADCNIERMDRINESLKQMQDKFKNA